MVTGFGVQVVDTGNYELERYRNRSQEIAQRLNLRYEEGLTLEQVARLAGLGNAQQADRRIKEILARLREEMSSTENRSYCP